MGLIVEHYVDPLNPRGWVAEPTRRRVALAYPDAAWTVRPVGMVESWGSYDGPEIPGGRAGMAATCARMSEEYGMPIDEYLWFDDPPTGSWPACRAIAAAGRDEVGGPALAGRLLRACREASFARRRSVSDPDGLRAVVASVPDLDADAVAAAVEDGRADEAFTAARDAAGALDLPGVEPADGRCALPTLVVRGANGSRGVSGVTDLAAVRAAVDAVGGPAPTAAPEELAAVLRRFSPEGWVARAELTAILGWLEDEVEAAVGSVDDAVIAETFAAEPFWRLAEFVPDGEDG